MSSLRQPKVIRFSTYFSDIGKTCPEDISKYGQCIAKNYSEINKDICQKEFLKLKKCFVKAVKQRRKR